MVTVVHVRKLLASLKNMIAIFDQLIKCSLVNTTIATPHQCEYCIQPCDPRGEDLGETWAKALVYRLNDSDGGTH
jgi:hypothetical protein